MITEKTLKKLTKQDLQVMVEMYDSQLCVLDLMLSDMSGVTLDTVHQWVDETFNWVNEYINRPKSKKHKQLKLF